MRTLTLLLLLLCASPAWAITLTPVLSAHYSTGFQLRTLTITTAEFTAFGNNDGTQTGTYQGVFYCQQSGNPCLDGAPFPTGVGTAFSVGCQLVPCPLGDVPVGLRGNTTFFVDPQHDNNFHAVVFFFEDTGIGFNTTGRGIVHADFGSSIPTPEPATWLLLASGLGVFLTRRFLCGT